jgi:hypothetical protein
MFSQAHPVTMIQGKNVCLLFWRNVLRRGGGGIELNDTKAILSSLQGCQMAYFHTQNPYLGKFWRVFRWKTFLYFMAI